MCIFRVLAFCCAAVWVPVQAKVVINEVLYHPPDSADAVEFVELHNSGAEAGKLSGWKFTKGIQYQFGESARIEAGGYFTLANNREVFARVYGAEPTAEFKGSLKRKGEKLELTDGAGKKVDSVKFKDSAPWPRSA